MRLSLKRQKSRKQKISSEDQPLLSLLSKKSLLKIESKQPIFTLNLPISSFTTIKNQSDLPTESLPSIISLTFTEKTTTTVMKNESQIVIDESNDKMMNFTHSFTISPAGSSDPNESIRISNDVLRVITKMSEMPWLNLFNYITLSITEEVISYKNTTTTRTRTIIERHKGFEMLFRIIKIFTIAYIGEETIDISVLSLKHIMKMMSMDITHMVPFIKIIISESKSFLVTQAHNLKRNILFNRSAILLSGTQESDTSYVTKFERNKEAKSVPQQDLMPLNKNRSIAYDFLMDLISKVNAKKEKIGAIVEPDDYSLVYCLDENGKKILLRLRLLQAIQKEENEYYDRYLVKDYLTQKDAFIKKGSIDVSKYSELIELIDERTKTKLLVEKSELKGKYELFAYYNQECVVVNHMSPDAADYTIRMIDIKEGGLDKAEWEIAQPQPEEERLIREKKEKIENEINSEPHTSELVDLGNGKIVLRNLMVKLKEKKDNLEYYTVNNSYIQDNPQVKITKEEIEKEQITYVESISSKTQSKTLIEKPLLTLSLSQWKKLSQRFNLKDNKRTANSVDLFYLLISHYSCGEIPIQLLSINQNLRNDLNADYYYYEGKDTSNKVVYIRKTYIEIITKMTKVFVKYYLIDYNKSSVVITPAAFKNNKCFIEVFNSEDNQSHLIPVDDLTKALDDKDNDAFSTTNSLGKVIHLKKTTIKITQQPQVEIGEQPEQYKDDLMSQIEDEFIEVEDTEDKSKHLILTQKLNQVITHKQTVLFETYVIEDNEGKMTHVTKAYCTTLIESKAEPHYILCKDSLSNKEYYLKSNQLREIDCGLQEEVAFDHQQDKGSKATLKLKHIKIVKLNRLTPLPNQPEEEFMQKVQQKIEEANKIEKGREYFEVTDSSNKSLLILKYYLNLIDMEKIGENEIEIIDCFSNKIIINRHMTSNQSENYFKIKDDINNSTHFSSKEALKTRLKTIRKQRDTFSLTDYHSNTEYSLSPLNYSIMKEDISNLPLRLIEPKPIEVPVIIPVIVNEEKDIRPQAVIEEEPVIIQQKEEIKEEDEEIMVAPPKPLKAVKPPIKQVYSLRRVIVKKIKKNY